VIIPAQTVRESGAPVNIATEAIPGASACNTHNQRPSDGFGGVVPGLGNSLVIEVLMVRRSAGDTDRRVG
jgi:hypothetical protein